MKKSIKRQFGLGQVVDKFIIVIDILRNSDYRFKVFQINNQICL